MSELRKIRNIIDKNKIYCAEDLWQNDSLNEKLPEIMEEICEIAGWAKTKEDDKN
jgi:hypothetical protein